MHACVELAGFAAAHAVCCVATGDTLRPIAVSERAGEAPMVTSLAGGRPDQIAEQGCRWLDENRDLTERTVVVVDGYITLASVRTDALILDICSYVTPVQRVRMAVPYRHGKSPAGFALHRPKFIVAELAGHDSEALTRAFFRGVSKHKRGARIWNACLDQSW